MCGEYIVGEGIYGERQLLSAVFFWSLTTEVAIPDWNLLLTSLDPPLFIHTLGNDCSIRVF